jgi:hypothetical protein
LKLQAKIKEVFLQVSDFQTSKKMVLSGKSVIHAGGMQE